MDVVVGGMRVGPRDDHHAKLATAHDQFAEDVAVREPLAAMVKRNLGRVIRHAAAGAQADCVRTGALEIIEPELQVKLAWIILD